MSLPQTGSWLFSARCLFSLALPDTVFTIGSGMARHKRAAQPTFTSEKNDPRKGFGEGSEWQKLKYWERQGP